MDLMMTNYLVVMLVQGLMAHLQTVKMKGWLVAMGRVVTHICVHLGMDYRCIHHLYSGGQCWMHCPSFADCVTNRTTDFVVCYS
jgi:hypothetical protein